VVRTESLLSAAVAALLVTSHLPAQTPDTAVASVTLADALRRSRMVAPTVVSAEGSIRTAQLASRTALLQFLPSLSLTPQANLVLSSGQSRLDPITQEIISGNTAQPSYTFGASATYTLFDGFARNHTLHQRQAQQAAANAQLTTAQFTSDYSATTAFFTALADKQLVAVAQSNLDAAQGQLTLASAKLQAGSGQLSDSLTALGTYLQARLGLLQAQSNLVVGEANLGRLVGIAGPVRAIDDSSFYQVPPALDTASIRQEMLTQSPTLKSLDANLAAAQQAYASTKAGYYPTASVTAAESWTGYFANGPNGDNSLKARRSLNLGISLTPWTNLQRETQVENAAIQITEAEANLVDERNALSAQVSQSFASLETAQETITVSTAAVVAGQENLRVVTERYRIGVATITDVLTAQQQLVTAQANQVQARYSYLLAKSQLEEILGRSL
jgi:outer membrane protein TolC